MMHVLAALDTSSSARGVLDTALHVGRLTGTTVVAVHVRTGAAEPVDMIEARCEEEGVALRVLSGDPGPILIKALGGPEVAAAVIGGCARPTPTVAGACRVTHAILERTSTPVVVTPQARGTRGEIHRLLLPLEGSDVSSRAVLDQLVPLITADVELEVLHVFTPDTVPAMLDQPAYSLDTLGKEFLSRHCPGADRIALRGGGVVDQVARVSVDDQVDLIVLTWSQSSSPRHAQVVRGVLEGSSMPVLLLPVQPPADSPADTAAVHSTITLVDR